MGGTIALLADQGHNVLLLDLTDGSPTPHGDRASRLPEAQSASQILAGATGRVGRLLLDLPNRTLSHTPAARHAVAGVIRAHQAHALFIPHPQDAHPDHLAATRIAEDARFDAKLTKVTMPVPPGLKEIGPPIYPKWVFYYYCSHLRRVPDPTFLIDTTTTAQRKRAAVEAYATQFGPTTHNAAYPELLTKQDAYFGSRIGTAAAEPFWTREPLGLRGLGDLALS
jgi:LmbE family N-acetylglucosaminyl deacetylase